MASAWYYAQDGQRLGPVSSRQLKQLAVGGRLRPTDLVWKAGMSDWAPAVKLKGLFPQADPAHAPATPDVEVKPLTPFDVAEAAPFDPDVGSAPLRPRGRGLWPGAGFGDLTAALKPLAADPVGGLKTAFDLLGPSRAMAVGLGAGLLSVLLFDAGLFFGGRGAARGFGELPVAPPAGLEVTFKALLRVTFVGLVLFAGVILGSLICRKVFQGHGSSPGDVFVAGVCLLPVGVAVPLVALLGPANFEVCAVLLVLALCLNVLILYSGCVKVHRLSERASTVAVPAIILLSHWVASVILRALS